MLIYQYCFAIVKVLLKKVTYLLPPSSTPGDAAELRVSCCREWCKELQLEAFADEMLTSSIRPFSLSLSSYRSNAVIWCCSTPVIHTCDLLYRSMNSCRRGYASVTAVRWSAE